MSLYLVLCTAPLGAYHMKTQIGWMLIGCCHQTQRSEAYLKCCCNNPVVCHQMLGSMPRSCSKPHRQRIWNTRSLGQFSHPVRVSRNIGVSQNEAAGTGSLSQGSVSRVCFVVCFGGLFRTVLLPRTVKFKGSVSGSVSKVCFGVCFGGLFRQSRTSQPYLKLHSPKKCKPIFRSQT